MVLAVLGVMKGPCRATKNFRSRSSRDEQEGKEQRAYKEEMHIELYSERERERERERSSKE